MRLLLNYFKKIMNFFADLNLSVYRAKLRVYFAKAIRIVKKRPKTFILLGLVMVAITVSIGITCAKRSAVKRIEEAIVYYEDYSINKDQYTIITDVVKVKENHYLVFTVEDTNGEVVLDCLDNELVWRIEEFDGINFEKNSLDIIVYTKGDEDTVYQYNGKGKWLLQ